MIPHSKPYLTEQCLLNLSVPLKSGMISHGRLSEEFKEKMGQELGVASTAIFLTPNGTSALQIILKALGVSKNDEVILPTYVCPSIAKAIYALGAIPVFCDIGVNWVSRPKDYEACVTPRTKAMVLVNTFGICVDPDEYVQPNIPLIWDRCHDYPHLVEASRVTAAFFSFHATKFMTAGQGGCAVCYDEALVRNVNVLYSEGEYSSFLKEEFGDLAACLGLSQLVLLPEMLAQRKSNADKFFSDITSNELQLPHEIRETSSFYRFPIKHNLDFEQLLHHFASRGVAVRRGVDTLLHRYFGTGQSHPVAEKNFNQTLSLPVYPGLTKEQLGVVIGACNEV